MEERLSTDGEPLIIQRPHACVKKAKRTPDSGAAEDTWELPILPTEKQNVLSAREHGGTKVSREKAVWSDIHDEVVRGQLRETFFTLCGLLPTDPWVKA